jgi:hypothetical protein
MPASGASGITALTQFQTRPDQHASLGYAPQELTHETRLADSSLAAE